MEQNIIGKVVLVLTLSLAGVLYLLILGGSIYEAIVFPQSPQRITLAHAVELDRQNESEFSFFDKALYVSITDAKWECASVKQVDTPRNRDDHTDGVFSNVNKDAFVFVQIHGLYSCQDLQEMEVAGKLQRFTKRPVEYESDTSGIVVIDESSSSITFELCTHCTPAEARFYPLWFFLFPFIMWGIFAYGKRQQQKQNLVNTVSRFE